MGWFCSAGSAQPALPFQLWPDGKGGSAYLVAAQNARYCATVTSYL